MDASTKVVTGHYIAFWGVPGEFYVQRPFGESDLAVIEFPPQRGRTTWRYATNGMSSCIQEEDGQSARTELYASAKGPGEWVVSLLDALARYPVMNQTILAEYDTVAVG